MPSSHVLSTFKVRFNSQLIANPVILPPPGCNFVAALEENVSQTFRFALLLLLLSFPIQAGLTLYARGNNIKIFSSLLFPSLPSDLFCFFYYGVGERSISCTWAVQKSPGLYKSGQSTRSRGIRWTAYLEQQG